MSLQCCNYFNVICCCEVTILHCRSAILNPGKAAVAQMCSYLLRRATLAGGVKSLPSQRKARLLTGANRAASETGSPGRPSWVKQSQDKTVSFVPICAVSSGNDCPAVKQPPSSSQGAGCYDLTLLT